MWLVYSLGLGGTGEANYSGWTNETGGREGWEDEREKNSERERARDKYWGRAY